MQLLNSGKKNHGQRYTDEQKSFCLAMYKQSPKNYRSMRGTFKLPSESTVGRHSAHLLFEAGIDKKFFEHLKAKVEDLGEIEKPCIIAWDEVSLTTHLDYSATKDVIDGFVELADARKPAFATHSLNFMVRGINMQYKQAVANFYTNAITSIELAELIDLVTKAVLDTGLVLIGSTCDQAGTNVSAVHIRIDPNCPSKVPDGKLLAYKIRDNVIIHCYDPPHLIKVLRNNLMKKDLTHCLTRRWSSSDLENTHSKQQQFASWDHITKLYNMDCQATYRRLPKITAEHIAPKKQKMRVSVAAQIFSATLGKVMLECSERQELPDHFAGTAQLLLFFNDLFDSMNGSGQSQVNKLLSGSIDENSPHFDFWEYALSMLSKMNFVYKETRKINNMSTVLRKVESTIRGYIELSKICLNMKISEVSIRNMNQDGLEHHFGSVKSCCQIPCAPIATQFRTGLATVMVNNVTSANSKNSNCEKESSFPLLNNLHELYLAYKPQLLQSNQEISENENESDVSDTIIFDPLRFSETELNIIDEEGISLTSNIICKTVLETTSCKKCRNDLQKLQTPTALRKHDINNKRATSDDYILTFHPSFILNCKKLLCAINEMIPHICSEKLLKQKLLSHIEGIKIDSIGCKKHSAEVSMKLKQCSTRYALKSYCQKTNDILSGKIKTISSNADHILKQALIYRQKRKRIGKYSDILKK